MSDSTFKPLTIEDFNVTPEEVKAIVAGAQKFLSPVGDDGESIPVTLSEPKDTNGSSS